MEKTLIEHSKTRWMPGKNAFGDTRVPSIQEIQVGCLQRIAAATEQMAGEITRLINEAQFYKDLAERRMSTITSLKRQIKDLKRGAK